MEAGAGSGVRSVAGSVGGTASVVLEASRGRQGP